MVIRHSEPTFTVGTGAPLLDGVLKPPSWTEDALCAQIDTECFFPDKGGSTRDAKRICRRCPVRRECLEYALAMEAGDGGVHTSYGPFGIYGGLTPKQRRTLLRARREAS